ncbi:jg19109, partial [Pararge aegeria aegeria]
PPTTPAPSARWSTWRAWTNTKVCADSVSAGTGALRRRNPLTIAGVLTPPTAQTVCRVMTAEKLSFFYPGEHADESLSQEQSDSVECLHCRPDCARLLYAATLSTVPYGPFVKKAFYNHFAYGLKLENGTVIRIYFNTKSQQLYLVESNLRVYEVIGAGALSICDKSLFPMFKQ